MMIAVFLFARWFRWYQILRVKPTPYGITFFRTSSWWLQCCEQSCGLWLVRCNLAMSVGIVPTINHDNLVTITIHLVLFMSWIFAYAAYYSMFYVSSGNFPNICVQYVHTSKLGPVHRLNFLLWNPGIIPFPPKKRYDSASGQHSSVQGSDHT